jgi:rhodanese-related sulfurtransferase
VRDPQPLVAALLLLAAGAALGLGIGAVRPGGLSLQSVARAEACESPGAQSKVTQVSPAEAAQLCAAGQVMIADARPAADYAAGHVAGAVHLPCTGSGVVAGEALQKTAGAQTLLVYGSTSEEAVAVAQGLAGRLGSGAGPRILALEGGFAAWEKAGLACASGPCDGCAVGK